MTRNLIRIVLVFVCPAWAQLIPPGNPVPRTGKPPVVFLNGYDTNCADSGFATVFAQADKVLEADGRVSLYFNNCDFAGKPPIEQLGQEFAKFLDGLRYTSGERVTTVDVVAYSMGGLVVRSYLSGKQPDAAAFNPPASIPLRKLIFVATPHFGTGIALGLGVDRQVEQLTAGSRFLLDLATWNQGADDLRGIDAIAIVGNGGLGTTTLFPTVPGFDDGVVTVTSGSLEFVGAGRTRAIPFCHTPGGGLISLFGLCSATARSVAAIGSAADPQGRIVLSFLNGTGDWRSVGTGVTDDRLLSANGGVYSTARAADDSPVSLTAAAAQVAGGASRMLTISNRAVAFSDRLPAGAATLTLNGTSAGIAVKPGVYTALVIKPGPRIAGVFPSAAALAPVAVAPGMFVSIYGESLAAGQAQAASADYPTQLSDAQVLVNSAPARLHYAGPTQINAVVPEDAVGLVQVTVKNASGGHTVNVMVEPAVPALITQNSTGSGAAAALSAVNNLVVTESNPLRAGDYVQLYLTGLGATTLRDGLEWANQQPSVTIGGQPCAVTYAGRAPGFRGLDQINCQIPPGLGRNPAAAVVVRSGSRTSNTATLALE